MRPLSRARRLALTVRAHAPPPSEGSLLAWVRLQLCARTTEQWSVEEDATLEADGVLDGPGRSIRYHPRIAHDLPVFRRVLAHELGHFVLHPRLRSSEPDPLGEFAAEDLAGRTSRFDWEETDAEAFAYELLCPAAEVLASWFAAPGANVDALAAQFSVPRDIAAVQLSRALADVCDGSPKSIALPPCTQGQLDAARAPGVAVYLDAGPGTGKTRTLIERVRWLVEDQGCRPEGILVLSFSNTAVGTVRERLFSLSEDWGGRVTVSTVHSLASEVVRRHRLVLGYRRAPTILDEADQVRRVRDLLCEEAWPSLLDPFRVVDSIDDLRRMLRARAVKRARLQWFSMAGNSESSMAEPPELERFACALSARHKAEHKVTFDELVELASEALTNPELAALWRSRYRHVVVDEAQDLAPASLYLILMLAPLEQPAWFAGDHRQRICGFQGADPNIVPWIRRYYGAQLWEVALKDNHRTEPEGVGSLNEIARSVDPGEQTSWQATRAPSAGDRPRGSAKFEVQGKAEGVATVVGLASAAIAAGAGRRDLVVLTRHNADAANAVRALRLSGITAFVPGGLDIDDVAGDLATMLDPGLLGPMASRVRAEYWKGRAEGRPAALTVARVREIVDASPPQLRRAPGAEPEPHTDASEDFAFDTLIRFLFEDGGYLRAVLTQRGLVPDPRLAQIATVSLMARGVHSHSAPRRHRRHLAQLILANCLGAPPLDSCRGGAIDGVRVMTIHQAKGREFEHVIALLTTPQSDGTVGPSSDHRWTPVACEAFVAASRGIRRTEFVLVHGREDNPFAAPLAALRPEATTPVAVQCAAPTLSFAAGSLWSPAVGLAVDGGFWRRDWCAMSAFVRSTLRVRRPNRDERLEVDALRLLKLRLREGFEGALEGTKTTQPIELPAPWTERIERLASQLRSALENAGVSNAIAAALTFSHDGEGRPLVVQLPVVGARFGEGNRTDTVILLTRGQAGPVDRGIVEGLADAVRYFLRPSAPRPKRLTVLTTGASLIDEKLGIAVRRLTQGTMDMSRPRVDLLISLRQGAVPAVPESYGCGRCSARLLCPAYHLPSAASPNPAPPPVA